MGFVVIKQKEKAEAAVGFMAPPKYWQKIHLFGHTSFD